VNRTAVAVGFATYLAIGVAFVRVALALCPWIEDNVNEDFALDRYQATFLVGTAVIFWPLAVGALAMVGVVCAVGSVVCPKPRPGEPPVAPHGPGHERKG